MTPDEPTAPPRLIVPEGLRYTCLLDGMCCSDAWEIQVEPEAAERIESVTWQECSALRPPQADTPFERSRARQGALLLRRAGAACHFLGDDNRCRLHADHGFQIKPQACRRFPFRFLDTPDGVYVGVSFGCNSVLRDEGHSLAEQRDEIAWLYAREPRPASVELPLRLDVDMPIGWETYKHLEAALDTILARADHPFDECLVAGHTWLNILLQAVAQVRRAQPDYPADDLALRYLGQTRADDFARAFAIAARRKGPAALKRILMGSFLALRNTVRPGTSRFVAAGRLTFENLRHWARVGSLRLEPLERRIPYGALRGAAQALQSTEAQSLLRRYYRHALFRKDAVAATDLFWGYCYFIMTYGMVQYYAAALEALGRPDPALALCYVEKCYVLHTGFGHDVLYHPALADTFQRVFHRPNFAHAIAYG